MCNLLWAGRSRRAAGQRENWLAVAGCVVFGEDIAAEIALRVAPHGVNVVGVALGVVVFDQEPRALDAVVMWPPRLGAAGPGEVQPAGSVTGDLRLLGVGGVVREPAEV